MTPQTTIEATALNPGEPEATTLEIHPSPTEQFLELDKMRDLFKRFGEYLQSISPLKDNRYVALELDCYGVGLLSTQWHAYYSPEVQFDANTVPELLYAIAAYDRDAEKQKEIARLRAQLATLESNS